MKASGRKGTPSREQERKEHSTCHKSQVAELGVARDGIGSSRKVTLGPVHQVEVLEFSPVGTGLEQGVTSSGLHFR